MDKLKGLVLSAFAGVLGFIGLASAQFGYFDTKSIAESIVRFYENFFGPIFAALFGQYYTNEFLFAKVLVFVLLVIIISFILKKSSLFGHRGGIIFLVSLIVSLLALRYLPENDLINGILLPYGVLGVALVTFLPFLIYFFFVHQSVPGGFGRRAAWFVYGIVFIVLFFLRSNDLSGASQWIYTSGLILVILALIFDKSLHRYFAMSELSRFTAGAKLAEIARLQAEYAHLGNADSPQIRARKKQIEERIRELIANS